MEQQSPADIAREAFKRLAVRRIAPTPEAYRDAYEEIAGAPSQPGAEKVLADFAASLANTSGELGLFAAHFRKALDKRDWEAFGRDMQELVEKHFAAQAEQAKKVAKPTPAKSASIPLVDPVEPAQPRVITLVDDVPPPVMKSQGISLVDEAPAPALAKTAKADSAVLPVVGETRQMQMLRELLGRTLTLAVGSLVRGTPALAEETEQLAAAINNAHSEHDLANVSNKLKQLCFKIELKAEDMAEEHELLLRLFKLLLENVSELLEDDSWLSGQIASVMDLLAGPISYSALMDATRSLKEVIYKQSLLKHSLTEAKTTVKNMMVTFIDRLGAVAVATGTYHEKMDQYAHKIAEAKGIPELNKILQDVMHDTKVAQTEALRSRDDMLAARQEVQEAEVRIHELEGKLAELSELVREDQLTGSLNRRGLDEVFEREVSRSERRHSPLCIAMLDLDDFKKLNDTHGHTAGDHALIHLVKVVKDTLRTMDVIARFGGEEFMIVLPETPLEDAIQTVTRVQRELTKQIFMYNNQRLLITFSSGVALHKPGESQQSIIERADEALYKAKKAGKNRVVAAD
ncbi:GGDEF domain-containing protein [Noviherbaspirillum denitrificans]|uniref:diguanylate cyclase n=1 Tax=Noviherbaspirillum denitrificans TaxID=1968433 RepID=A0A254TE39_9BURK|nr:GGDEF domain-containing protein [Noviherbaspirillum denitrificans]OWW20921.1 diguanylate cyclase [Noviherbaspirillum denitrificans]